MRILVINGGSSSFKCAAYDVTGSEGALMPVWKQNVLDWTGAGDAEEVLDPVIEQVGPVDAVGHRIVHGGSRYRDSIVLNPEVREAIASQAEVAPSHNRFELEAIDAATRVMGPDVPQIAVFDTAFHASIEPAAYVYPGPYDWLTDEGIQRFGFHGISYQYASRRVAELLGKTPQRLLLCHLGSGASLCAVRDGKSIDTTMGFTPLEGLMMGTRSGSLDPGIIVYLLRHRGYTPSDLDRILNRESGLLGLSGFSADLREILHRAKLADERARLALGVYQHRLIREAGGMLAALGGLDALAFTGGVGEHSAEVRQALCGQLGFVGLRLDAQKNTSVTPDANVSEDGSPIPVMVIHAEEEAEIARECFRVLHS